MKRSLALGALMAFVITGSAMANSAYENKGSVDNVNISGAYDMGIHNSSGKEINFSGANIVIDTVPGKDWGKGNVGIRANASTDGVSIINLGEKGKSNISINVVDSYKGEGDGDISIGIWANGALDKDKKNGGKIVVEGNSLRVTGYSEKGWIYGVYAQNKTVATGMEKATININATNTYINVDSAIDGAADGIVAMSQGIVNIESNLEVYADNAVVARGDSVVKINADGIHTTKLNGDIVFDYDAPTSGTKVDSEVVVNLNGKDSYWNGNTKISWSSGDKNKPGANLLDVNNVTINLSNGAQWNVEKITNEGSLSDTGAAVTESGIQYLALNNLKLDGGIVNLEKAEDQTVKIENIEGKGEILVANEKNSLEVTKKNNSTNITVGATTEYSKELAKGDIAKGLQQIADQVVDNTTGAGKSAADNVTMAETGVLGETSVQVDDNGNIIVETIKEDVNSSNAGIAQMGSVALMTWRQENNDMNKRLGELRNSKGEHGIWTRMTRGESDFEGIKNQYNAYQIGYDEKLSTDKSWTVGAALTYTEGKSSFAEGTGENTHKGFAVYGSKLNEDGSFIDLIAKYARLDHEFDALGGAGNGEYDTNGYSVSAEYGKRFDKGNGFWVEPQVELTYGKIGSASYKTSEGVTVAQDGMDSLVGRVGFSLGKDIKDGNVYVRASYLYDFDGETSMSFSDGQYTRTMEQDLGGGWFEVGVGTNINLSDATYVYLDVEKTYGGDVATPWQWNAGVRYSF